jgi:hypothetical protein
MHKSIAVGVSVSTACTQVRVDRMLALCGMLHSLSDTTVASWVLRKALGEKAPAPKPREDGEGGDKAFSNSAALGRYLYALWTDLDTLWSRQHELRPGRLWSKYYCALLGLVRKWKCTGAFLSAAVVASGGTRVVFDIDERLHALRQRVHVESPNGTTPQLCQTQAHSCVQEGGDVMSCYATWHMAHA